MLWSVPLAMSAPEQLLPLARVVEHAGYDAIAMPESVFFPERVSAKYPYSDDGERFWAPDTPFVDPFVAIPAMAAITETVTFYTNVMKVPLRDPLLLAKAISSIAVLSGNRFSLGVGLSWIPEEFTYTGTDKKTRGARADEIIEIVKKVCAGDGPQWVEHHGHHYDFEKVMISPAPDAPVSVLGAGHSEPAMRRAARLCDGWISVQATFAELEAAISRLNELRAEYGRADEPFEFKVLCTEAFDLDSMRRVAALGATEIQAVPWYFYGGDPDDLEVRRTALERFAEEVVHPMADG